MNSTYNQLIKNLEYLKMKQMINHLDEVIDFTTKNNLSFVDALIKLTTGLSTLFNTFFIRSYLQVYTQLESYNLKNCEYVYCYTTIHNFLILA